MRGRSWSACLCGAFLSLALASGAQSSLAGGITISGVSTNLDIHITEDLPCKDAVSAIAYAVGASLEGDCGDEMVAQNHLRHVTLRAALDILVPHKPFVVMLAGQPPRPTDIIFPTAPSGALELSRAPVATSTPLVPEVDRADYIKHLPMLRTR